MIQLNWRKRMHFRIELVVFLPNTEENDSLCIGRVRRIQSEPKNPHFRANADRPWQNLPNSIVVQVDFEQIVVMRLISTCFRADSTVCSKKTAWTSIVNTYIGSHLHHKQHFAMFHTHSTSNLHFFTDSCMYCAKIVRKRSFTASWNIDK